jgi:hypothetical protein
MAPKSSELGDTTPTAADKKKFDTTPSHTPVVDKEVTPTEDDKKKKDPTISSSSGKKGDTTTNTSRTSGATQLTELTELGGSPSRGSGKRKDMAAAASRKRGGFALKSKKRQKDTAIMNKKLKHLRKSQAKKMKHHPRSFSGNIMRILRSVNESPPVEDAVAPKRVNQLSMMIFDSFANDLSDKIISTAVELLKNTNKRQLGSAEIRASMKLVLPADMATCCEEAIQVSLASYRESTKKFQIKIAKAKGNKKTAKTGTTQKD